MPRVIIKSDENGNYVIDEPIVIPLPVYQTKLVKSKLRVEIEESKYAGHQVMPKVSMYYMTPDGEIQLQENVTIRFLTVSIYRQERRKGWLQLVERVQFTAAVSNSSLILRVSRLYGNSELV